MGGEAKGRVCGKIALLSFTVSLTRVWYAMLCSQVLGTPLWPDLGLEVWTLRSRRGLTGRHWGLQARVLVLVLVALAVAPPLLWRRPLPCLRPPVPSLHLDHPRQGVLEVLPAAPLPPLHPSSRTPLPAPWCPWRAFPCSGRRCGGRRWCCCCGMWSRCPRAPACLVDCGASTRWCPCCWCTATCRTTAWRASSSTPSTRTSPLPLCSSTSSSTTALGGRPWWTPSPRRCSTSSSPPSPSYSSQSWTGPSRTSRRSCATRRWVGGLGLVGWGGKGLAAL